MSDKGEKESEMEPLAEMLSDDIREGCRRIADSITPVGAAPGHDESGGVVCSLTESVMGMTAGLHAIAQAINNLAEAVRERDNS